MRPTISDPFRGATAILQSRHDASPELLVKELQHRIRNLLSVVQCFVINTEAQTADDYRDALTARLATLSDAYNLIESAREHRVSLRKLVERTLKPHALLPNDRRILLARTRHRSRAAFCFVASHDLSRAGNQRQQARGPDVDVR